VSSSAPIAYKRLKCSDTSTRRQRRNLFGLRVKLP